MCLSLSFDSLQPRLLSAVVAVIIIIAFVVPVIVMTVPVVPAVFPANIMAVNPTMAVRHVAWHPNSFIVASPIASAMVIEWPVANLDFKALRSHSDRKKDTRSNDGDE